MSTCTLNWYSDRGFELDLDAEDEEVSLRMVAIPVPADGTGELRRAPVELDRLEILFKARVEVQGEPGQLQEAAVRLVVDSGREHLELTAKVEDMETGDLLPFTALVPVRLPSGVPVSGGPRPQPADEDELDWEDETTLEQMIVNAPETTSRMEREELGELDDLGDLGELGEAEVPEERPRTGGGLKALLEALANLGDEDEEPAPGEEEPTEPEPAPPMRAPGTASATPSRPAPRQEPKARLADPEPRDDQQMGAEQEAEGLLQLLVDRDGLELEEDCELSDLVPGVMKILDRRAGPESKAKALSTWLLAQPAVADLFIGDDELAEILEQW